MSLSTTDGINVLIVMGSTDVRIYSGQRTDLLPTLVYPELDMHSCASRTEQKHTRGRRGDGTTMPAAD